MSGGVYYDDEGHHYHDAQHFYDSENCEWSEHVPSVKMLSSTPKNSPLDMRIIKSEPLDDTTSVQPENSNSVSTVEIPPEQRALSSAGSPLRCLHPPPWGDNCCRPCRWSGPAKRPTSLALNTSRNNSTEITTPHPESSAGDSAMPLPDEQPIMSPFGSPFGSHSLYIDAVPDADEDTSTRPQSSPSLVECYNTQRRPLSATVKKAGHPDLKRKREEDNAGASNKVHRWSAEHLGATQPLEMPLRPPGFLYCLAPASPNYVSVSYFKNCAMVHIRTYSVGKDGVEYPTKKGICMTASLWPVFEAAAQTVSGLIDHTIELTDKHRLDVEFQQRSVTYTLYHANKQPSEGVTLTEQEWEHFIGNFPDITGAVQRCVHFIEERRRITHHYLVQAGAKVLIDMMLAECEKNCWGCLKLGLGHSCEVLPSYVIETRGKELVKKIDFKTVYQAAVAMEELIPPMNFSMFKAPFKDHVYEKAKEMCVI